jgi:heme/copper-type cytochrome/quinol oxidase subunit 2
MKDGMTLFLLAVMAGYGTLLVLIFCIKGNVYHGKEVKNVAASSSEERWWQSIMINIVMLTVIIYVIAKERISLLGNKFRRGVLGWT